MGEAGQVPMGGLSGRSTEIVEQREAAFQPFRSVQEVPCANQRPRYPHCAGIDADPVWSNRLSGFELN